MAKRWTHTEQKILIDNYEICTIFELMELLPNRDRNAINCKIKRLKKEAKLEGNRTPETVSRAHNKKIK